MKSASYLGTAPKGTPPEEIYDSRYTVGTDIYFLGRLFEKIIVDTENTFFEYNDILKQMTKSSQSERVTSFLEIKKSLNTQFSMKISDDDKKIYQQIAGIIEQSIECLHSTPKFDFDTESVLRKLRNILTKVVWENTINNIKMFVDCFFENINCSYTQYWKDDYGDYGPAFDISTEIVENFVNMFSNLTKEKKQNLLENLYYNRISNISVSK